MSSALGTGISRVLGLFRETVTAALLGAGETADIWNIAFTIPNAFRRFVADEGLTGALLPAFMTAEVEDGMDAAQHLANQMFAALLVVNFVLCGVLILGAELAVTAFAYEFTKNPEQFATTVTLTRWLIPFLGMVSLVGLCEAMLNHKGHFFTPKVAPGLVSLGMVTGGLGLTGWVDPLWALAGGTLVGGLAHVLVNVPMIRRLWGPVGIDFSWHNNRFRGVAREMSKVVLIGLLAQANVMVLRQVATSLGTGAVSQYWYANRLVDLAQGIIAVSIGSALLPNVSRSVAERNMDQLRRDMERAFRLAAFLLLPASMVLLCFSEPTVAMVYRVGKFSAETIPITAAVLQMFVPFMLAVAAINLIKRVYFALEDRNTLLAVGTLGVLLTGGIGWALGQQFGISGMVAGLSLSTCLQFVAYITVLQQRLGGVVPVAALAGPLAKMAAASLPVGAILWASTPMGDWDAGPLNPLNWLVYGTAGVLSLIAYGLMAQLLKIEEFQQVSSRLLDRFRR